jgi:uncharacterized MAPEG superfamily protein
MHPDIMREVASQRAAERRAAARNASTARALRKAIRAQRHRAETTDAFVAPAIPDYVDGTFHGAENEVPAQRTGAGC